MMVSTTAGGRPLKSAASRPGATHGGSIDLDAGAIWCRAPQKGGPSSEECAREVLSRWKWVRETRSGWANGAQPAGPAPRPPWACTVSVRVGSLRETHTCVRPKASCVPVRLCRGGPRSGRSTAGSGRTRGRQTGLPELPRIKVLKVKVQGFFICHIIVIQGITRSEMQSNQVRSVTVQNNKNTNYISNITQGHTYGKKRRNKNKMCNEIKKCKTIRCAKNNKMCKRQWDVQKTMRCAKKTIRCTKKENKKTVYWDLIIDSRPESTPDQPDRLGMENVSCPWERELSWERVGRMIELPWDVNSTQWLELRVTPEEEMAGELWHAVWSYTPQPVDIRDRRSVVRAD